MPRTSYTAEAREVVGNFVLRAGKTSLVVRCGDGPGETVVCITPGAVAEFYAARGDNLLSGCRTLAGLTGDRRPVSELARAALDWFRRMNVAGMRRAARRFGLVPRF